MICQRQGVHPKLLRLTHQRGNGRNTVAKTEVTVNVSMDKVLERHSYDHLENSL